MSSFDFEIHSDELAACHEYEMREDLARWQDEYEEYILHQTRYDDNRDDDYYTS